MCSNETARARRVHNIRSFEKISVGKKFQLARIFGEGRFADPLLLFYQGLVFRRTTLPMHPEGFGLLATSVGKPVDRRSGFIYANHRQIIANERVKQRTFTRAHLTNHGQREAGFGKFKQALDPRCKIARFMMAGEFRR